MEQREQLKPFVTPQVNLLIFAAVMVSFDSYSGPTSSDGTVPIVPIICTWGQACSRFQLLLGNYYP